jgi:DNA repair exonuclease SbcCD nuclease subunit
MRICHFADSHLGAGANHRRRAASGLTERQEDILAGYVEAIDRIIEIKPDVCIHAGDLFDSVRPLNSIMARAAEQLHRLATLHSIPTIIIAGNHDAPKQPHVGAALEVFKQIENLYVAASGVLEKFRIGQSCFFALPHCMTVPALKDQLALCEPDPDADFNVLIMHGVAAGMPEFSMADLGEQELPLELMAKFDYTALGHFHNFCQVGPRAWYSGSTERLSQSERESAKGFAVVDLDSFAVRLETVKTRPMVDISKIDATGKRGDELAQIIREKVEAVGSSDKIVRVKIDNVTAETLQTMPAEALAELKEKSFALDIQFKKAAPEGEQAQFGRTAIGRLDQSFLEYLETVDMAGFDKQELIKRAMKYLGAEE